MLCKQMHQCRIVCFGIVACFCALLFGCGGGSSGTDGGISTRDLVRGTVFANSETSRIEATTEDTAAVTGKPISGAVVTIVETDESDITDSEGRFEISTHLIPGTIQLDVSSNGKTVKSDPINVGEVSDDKEDIVTVRLTVSELFNQLFTGVLNAFD